MEHGSLDSDSDEATFVVYSNRIHLKQEVAVVDGEEGAMIVFSFSVCMCVCVYAIALKHQNGGTGRE